MFTHIFLNLLRQTSSQLLNDMLIVSLQEDDDGVELGVVEAVHRVGRDVQQRVLPSLHDSPDAGQTDDAARFGFAVF